MKIHMKRNTSKPDQRIFLYKLSPATIIFLLIFIITGITSLVYAYRRMRNVDQKERKIFLRKHTIYVLFFIGIWSVYSISNGISTYCYFNHRDSKGGGNKAIYEACFKELGGNKDTLLFLFNVNPSLNL